MAFRPANNRSKWKSTHRSGSLVVNGGFLRQKLDLTARAKVESRCETWVFVFENRRSWAAEVDETCLSRAEGTRLNRACVEAL
jgi:hypothetical protein